MSRRRDRGRRAGVDAVYQVVTANPSSQKIPPMKILLLFAILSISTGVHAGNSTPVAVKIPVQVDAIVVDELSLAVGSVVNIYKKV